MYLKKFVRFRSVTHYNFLTNCKQKSVNKPIIEKKDKLSRRVGINKKKIQTKNA